MSKIGRNDLCPCGSNKKYKKCHYGKISEEDLLAMFSLNNEEEETGNSNSEILTYDQTTTLISIAALQLHPKNHGKNIRFEKLTFEVLKEGKNNTKIPTRKNLSDIFESNNLSDPYEDPIASFFTENSIFYGGNYTIYPGITTGGSSTFNTFLESIFVFNNALPEKFKNKLEPGVTLLLCLSDAMAHQAGHTRYLFDDEIEEEIFVPGEAELDKLRNAVYFDRRYINDICKHLRIPEAVLKEFLILEKDLPGEYNPDDFILNRKPILELRKGYVFLLPPSIVECGVSYIKRLAKEENCERELIETYHRWQWNKVIEHAMHMGWRLTNIKLPKNKMNLNLTESVFQFDRDKLAYVCMVQHKRSFGEMEVVEEENESDYKTFAEEQERQSNLYEERNKEVIAFLTKFNKANSYRYFTLFLLGGMGETSFFSWNKPEPGNQTLTFSFSDFEKIVFDGEVNNLTLWKFSKAYLKATENTRIGPFTSMLDSYVLYKDNYGSILPINEAAPTMMIIDMAMSAEFERNALKKRDEHAAKKILKGGLVDTPVIRHKQYAPIYTERELSSKNQLLIETFKFPLWIINTQADDPGEKESINDFVEAIAFWMFRLSASIESELNNLGTAPIEILVELDEKYLTATQEFEWEDIQGREISLPTSVAKREIKITVPFNLVQLLISENNEAERLIMKAILDGFDKLLSNNSMQNLSEDSINKIIDAVIPLGPAKMILRINSADEPRLNALDIIETRYVEETETSFILDNLVSYINPENPIPANISTATDKKTLCNRIVIALIEQIELRLIKFDAREILDLLIRYNERYVFNREYREYEIPAKIACFSNFPSEVEHYLRNEKKLVNSSLSLRCLIEFVAADPKFGKGKTNMDDVDELLALMNEVCQWGITADTIHYEMDDPKMGLLPSGRIGMSHDFYENYLKPFSAARAENQVHGYTKSFERKMKIDPDVRPAEYTVEAQEIDEAFIDEWNISITKIMYLMNALMRMGMENGSSMMAVEESKLIKNVKKIKPELSNEEIIAGLKLFSLEARGGVSKVPKGFDRDDIYPWRYNRSHSHIRRPLIKLVHPEDNKVYYYWGFRHIMAAAENLRVIVMNGRIKAKPNGKLNSLIAKINDQKGKDFRRLGYNWLVKNTGFEVIPYEVTINESGHLKAEKDYGDIDILVIDKKGKIIYPIECKNTISARVVHEMKTELDKYLGRENNPGMIQKHVERDKWLKENQGSLTKFVDDPLIYQVKSFVLSSEEIPIIYLAKDSLPMPIFSFQTLNRKGWDIINF